MVDPFWKEILRQDNLSYTSVKDKLFFDSNLDKSFKVNGQKVKLHLRPVNRIESVTDI